MALSRIILREEGNTQFLSENIIFRNNVVVHEHRTYGHGPFDLWDRHTRWGVHRLVRTRPYFSGSISKTNISGTSYYVLDTPFEFPKSFVEVFVHVYEGDRLGNGLYWGRATIGSAPRDIEVRRLTANCTSDLCTIVDKFL